MVALVPPPPSRGLVWIRDLSGLVCSYVSEKTWGLDYGTDALGFGLFDAQGIMQGGVVLHDYDGRSILFSIALEDGTLLSRTHLDYIQSIIFDEIGAHRMVTRTPATNERGLRMARLFGLKQEGVEREAAPNSDDVVRCALLSTERRRFTKARAQPSDLQEA